MANQTRDDQEALMTDLQSVLADTESMLKDVSANGGEMASAMRDRITTNLNNVKAKLTETQQMVSEKAKVAAKVTDEYVRDNPWQSVGVATAVGFLVGLLVSRR